MSIIITSPVAGSLKITNSSASPQSNYLCNLQTINVSGNPFFQQVNLANEQQQTIVSFPLTQLATIGGVAASGFTLQQAVDAISLLIIH